MSWGTNTGRCTIQPTQQSNEQSTVIAMLDVIHQYHANVEINPDMIGINHTNVSAIKILTQENHFNALQDIEVNSWLHISLLQHTAGGNENHAM
jgi:hypothetical protein